MDRPIEKKFWSKKRILMIAAITGIAVLIGLSIYLSTGNSKLNVDTERITISEVKKALFKEYIPVNGVVLPMNTIYLDAMEGGRVEEKYVEDGTVMAKGQPILRLSNSDLMLNLLTQQSQVYNTLTQMQIAQNAAQQNTVSKLNQMADVESQLKEAKRVYEMNKYLYENNAIGLQEFKKSENDYNYYAQKKELSERILKQDEELSRQQTKQAGQSYAGSQRTLGLFSQKVGDLIVRAPVAGQLTSLDAEIGQSVNKGTRLGQLDVIGSYKVRADIDEHYISRIFTGLTGEASIANKPYQLTVKKVFSQVNNGRFQVDLEFVKDWPSDIRRGQTIQISLALSDETTALLLPKGGFYQQTGGNWVFKVSENGKIAYKVDVQLGRQNPDYYEVMNGLKPGDKVVTSSYENYGDMQELVLKNH
ncbi:efflux RND transporter periplasmic adaptor subunit [Haoranjiania flava]|uniref:HlyD family efflux transporter periplasmic adaptor subunit n=1 Tax=Haoranjiania flava TaxID=1856322 RepID=A0AAE3IMS7_9BACT|nr:HlyD family efflux transporter periplasmic adaptor subunit [Haoranjiania flava]MCU7694818.1 HlyD family efflux transporter periplasmic adaptor subunit [Haoranjiania flava]